MKAVWIEPPSWSVRQENACTRSQPFEALCRNSVLHLPRYAGV